MKHFRKLNIRDSQKTIQNKEIKMLHYYFLEIILNKNSIYSHSMIS